VKNLKFDVCSQTVTSATGVAICTVLLCILQLRAGLVRPIPHLRFGGTAFNDEKMIDRMTFVATNAGLKKVPII
jgi:hypothetical protein